jgi:hypothetical protein
VQTEQSCVGIVAACSYNSQHGLRVNEVHLADLEQLVLWIILDDADCIDPGAESPGRPDGGSSGPPNFALPLVPLSAVKKRDQVSCIEPCPTRASRLPSFSNVSSRIPITDRPSHHPCYCRTAMAFAPLRCSPWFQLTPWQQGLWGRLSSPCPCGQLPLPRPAQVVEPKRALLPRKPEHFPFTRCQLNPFSLTKFTHFSVLRSRGRVSIFPSRTTLIPHRVPFTPAPAQWLRGGGEDSSGPVMIWRRRGQGKRSLLRNVLGWTWTTVPILQSQPKSGVKG